jgi:hypothetical protein
MNTFWLLAAIAFFYGLFWIGLLELLSRLGGWKRGAARYRATDAPQGRRFRMQHIAFGWLDYNGCVTIIVSPDGVYLSLWPPFRLSHPALLIPWSALHAIKIKSSGWFPQAKLAIDEPPLASLTLPYKVIEAAQELAPAWQASRAANDPEELPSTSDQVGRPAD